MNKFEIKINQDILDKIEQTTQGTEFSTEDIIELVLDQYFRTSLEDG